MVDQIYLSINEPIFEKQKAQAKETSIENSGDDGKNQLTWETEKLIIDEIYFEDGVLHLAGEMGELGYISLSFDTTIELIIPIIEYYMKQVNKMKTVLEATR